MHLEQPIAEHSRSTATVASIALASLGGLVAGISLDADIVSTLLSPSTWITMLAAGALVGLAAGDGCRASDRRARRADGSASFDSLQPAL